MRAYVSVYAVWGCLWRDELSALRSCESVCLCVYGSMPYLRGGMSCLFVEELWNCGLTCMWEYAVLADM